MDNNTTAAQPLDRGAAQVPDGFVWPEPPPSKGQSHVLFEDGYAEGWAKAIDTVRSRLAAAPSPASQPVAPEAAPAGKLWKDHEVRILVNDLRAIAQAFHATEQLRGRISDRVGRFLDAAVAPSDAKGKADAANAGGLIPLAAGLPLPEDHERVLVYTEGVDFNTDQYFEINTEDLWEPDPDLRTEVAEAATHWMPLPRPGISQSATSAADAKDAARYRFLRDHGVDHSEPADDALLVYRGFGESSLLPDQLDEAIDAAMAAAPSSEKGGDK